MADYYTLLGVGDQATAGEIRQAYVRLARERHPDRFVDAAEKRRAEAELQEITTAFNTLVNPRSRQEYDEARLQPKLTPEELAREAAARARALLETGEVGEAVALLRGAVHHAPGDLSHQVALGTALARLPGGGREAVLVLERVVQQAPRSVTAFVELSTVLAREGLRLRALRALESARRLAPNDARVAQLAAELKAP